MSKNKRRYLAIFLSLALVILCVFGLSADAQAAPNRFLYKKCSITNYATNRPLNIYATSAANVYNGVKVNTFSHFVNDDTQWFYVRNFSPFETAILSENETFALNIGYRGVGSKAVMYDKNLDLETWDFLPYDNDTYLIRLHSDNSLYLREDPNTHDVYLARPQINGLQLPNLSYFMWKVNTLD